MSSIREHWTGPSGAAFMWGILVVLATTLLLGGYYWGQGSNIQTNADRRMDTADRRTDALEKHIIDLSNSDRAYTDQRVRDAQDSEQRDIRDLNEKVGDIKLSQTKSQETLGVISGSIEGIKADLKYAIGQRARGP